MSTIWDDAFMSAARTEAIAPSTARRTGAGPLRRLREAWVGFLDEIAARRKLARSRQALLTLDPRLLDDIGLERHVALREAKRSAWRGRQTRWW